MNAENILTELKELSPNDKITKSELMVILKKYARIISVNDLMLATARMRKDGEYVQANYREKYLKVYIKYFIMRMKEVKEKEDYVFQTKIRYGCSNMPVIFHKHEIRISDPASSAFDHIDRPCCNLCGIFFRNRMHLFFLRFSRSLSFPALFCRQFSDTRFLPADYLILQ